MVQSLPSTYRAAWNRGDALPVAVHGVGVALGFAAFFLFVASRFAEPGGQQWWLLREAAGVAGGVGVVAALLGAAVAGSHRHLEVAGGGAVASLVGVAVFVTAYPAHWNGVGPADLTVEAVAVYAVGVCALLAAAGATAVEHEGDILASATGEETAASDFDWVDDADVRGSD